MGKFTHQKRRSIINPEKTVYVIFGMNGVAAAETYGQYDADQLVGLLNTGLERDAAQNVAWAQVKMLREALQRIAAGNSNDTKPGQWLADIEMADIAREVLERTTPPADAAAEAMRERCKQKIREYAISIDELQLIAMLDTVPLDSDGGA